MNDEDQAAMEVMRAFEKNGVELAQELIREVHASEADASTRLLKHIALRQLLTSSLA